MSSNDPESGTSLPKLDEALQLIDHAVSSKDLLQQHYQHLQELPASAEPLHRARILLDIAETLVALERGEEAWNEARRALDIFIQEEAWQDAVEACNVLYQADQDASISALGQGAWLAVTYPVEADTSIAILQHIVEETPADSDGAAIAAAVAHYLAGLRSQGEKRDSLLFLTTNILAQVAKRHSGIDSQEALDAWLLKLQLTEPSEFLPRLAAIIDVMVQDQWWFDRDQLREKLPVN